MAPSSSHDISALQQKISKLRSGRHDALQEIELLKSSLAASKVEFERLESERLPYHSAEKVQRECESHFDREQVSDLKEKLKTCEGSAENHRSTLRKTNDDLDNVKAELEEAKRLAAARAKEMELHEKKLREAEVARAKEMELREKQLRKAEVSRDEFKVEVEKSKKLLHTLHATNGELVARNGELNKRFFKCDQERSEYHIRLQEAEQDLAKT